MRRYPLSAIVGQQALVDALLVNAVCPEVGGVLVRGERGTAKSTAVRALAPLLPAVEAVADGPFAFAPGDRGPAGVVAADAGTTPRPAPLVEVPLGATLDRLLGALDLALALDGRHAFEPGLLARAHRGILYVDEVNLLPDHLVDALLDVAATGVARVERDSVSVEHDARFLLVGTMNVEEGELRPQLLDRFGLGVEVRTPRDPAARAEIVRRRVAFDEDPQEFAASFESGERELAQRIARARASLAAVVLPERELMRITGACARLQIDGVRGDLVCARAARALAALDGVAEVGEDHVRRAAALALAHRRRRDPLDAAGADPDGELERALDGDDDEPEPPPPRGEGQAGPAAGGGRSSSQMLGRRPDPRHPTAPLPDAPTPAAEARATPVAAAIPSAALRLAGAGRGPHGRRAPAAGLGAGEIDSRPAGAGSDDYAVVATLRVWLAGRGRPSGHRQDPPAHASRVPLREHVRGGREGVLLCLVVDASGSMGARARLARVKGALLGVLRDAYARRDRVAVIAFRDGGAFELVAPGAPLERAAAAIQALPAGGRTPLAAGLHAARALVSRERARDPRRRVLAIVLTDGRVSDRGGAARAAAAALGRVAAAVHVVDTEDGVVRLGLAAELAAAAGASLHSLTGESRAA